MKLLKILDFTDSRHVKTVFELADFDLLDRNLSTGGDFLAFVDHGIRSLPQSLASRFTADNRPVPRRFCLSWPISEVENLHELFHPLMKLTRYLFLVRVRFLCDVHLQASLRLKNEANSS